MVRKKIWFCERCKTVGGIRYGGEMESLELMKKIQESHKKQSPNCDQPVTEIGVLHGSISELPQWAQHQARRWLDRSVYDHI